MDLGGEDENENDLKYSKSTIVACVACALLAIALVRDVITQRELILQNEELQDQLSRR